MEQWKGTVVNFLTLYGFQIIGAIIILAAGALVARWLGNLAQKWLEKQQLELPIRTLLVRVVRLLVLGFTLVVVLEKLGVQVTALVAGIGVAGVGVGLAMQGVLGNVVAGLTIIFTKPFRVGEYIELLGVYGQVTNVELFSTTLVHADQSRVVIPNRKIVGEIMHNYGAIRQMDLNVGVAYGANLTEVVSTLREILGANPRVLKEPAAVVGINALGDSSINITIQPWVKVPDFGMAQLELYQAIVEQFRARQIEIPFPQHEVRMLDDAAAK
jgi:small conductance mechanosensitive channel